jgi:hypothetical protein
LGEQTPLTEPATVEGQVTRFNAAHDQVACVTITWASGEATTVYPPSSHRLAGSPS